jgi:type 1 glutamine amidotransferase
MDMRALVLCGDHWHPAHVTRQGLEALGEGEGSGCFHFDWIEDAREWSAGRMADYRVVVMTKSDNVSERDSTSWVTEEVQKTFLDYVRQGNGLLVVHAGSAGYEHMPVLRGLMGGVFLRHPPQCPVAVEPQQGHALTAGSSPFTVVDEHYIMVLDDAEADVFVTTTTEHGTQPGGWTRTEGEGRVCMLTPGHNVEVWLHPSFQALLRNALYWCGFLSGAR